MTGCHGRSSGERNSINLKDEFGAGVGTPKPIESSNHPAHDDAIGMRVNWMQPTGVPMTSFAKSSSIFVAVSHVAFIGLRQLPRAPHPAALYAKSITLSWQTTRVRKVEAPAECANVAGASDEAENKEVQEWRTEGCSLIAHKTFRSRARRLVVDFDNDYKSCSLKSHLLEKAGPTTSFRVTDAGRFSRSTYHHPVAAFGKVIFSSSLHIRQDTCPMQQICEGVARLPCARIYLI